MAEAQEVIPMEKDTTVLEIEQHVIGLVGCMERNFQKEFGLGFLKADEKYVKYILESHSFSGVGGHFDGYLWASSSPDMDFRYLTKSTILSDWSDSFRSNAKESSRNIRSRWIGVLNERNGQVEFSSEGREYTVVLNKPVNLEDAIKTVYSSVLCRGLLLPR
ncbi:MAG: hypothetical protein WCI72_00520 [archaeon]